MTTLVWLTAFLDRPGPAHAAAGDFWCAVTGTAPSTAHGPDGEFTILEPPEGAPVLRAQRLRTGEGGWHADLHVVDVATAAVHAIDLGARPVLVLDDPDGHRRVVLTSPAGLPFCLVPHHGITIPAPPGPADPVRLDVEVPGTLLETETRFWADLTEATGVPAPDGGTALVPPMPMPMVLGVRPAPDAATRYRPVLACDDLDVTVADHLALGAGLLPEGAGVPRPGAGQRQAGGRGARATVGLEDPSGVPYRVALRSVGAR